MASAAVGNTVKKATTTTTGSTLLNRFLRLRPPITATSTLTHRFLCSKSAGKSSTTATSESARETGEKTSNSQESPLVIKGSPQEFKMENPFQSGGPKDVVAVDELKDGILVRVTLPGIAQDGCRVWVENNTVFFAGRGEIELESETSGRTYGGSLEFDPDFSKVEEVKSEMKNGILKMIIPNVGGLDSVLGGKDQEK
ncbi:14.7 kDa heat shock protein-like [Coffea arabica]|uniref:14.7 kDa heat shock protein-like n=1 Tax=Coffea arabica TaxID=13443 RepID=A0ABM4VFN8_COFAR|nr:14.7 kDa heat shock protein-like [Coffea arabica]